MYRFKNNDIIYNTVKTYPVTKFVAYSGSLFINNSNNEGAFTPGAVYVNNLNLSGSELNFLVTSNLSLTGSIQGYAVTSSSPISFTLYRDFVYHTSPDNSYNVEYTNPRTLFKFLSIQNSMKNYETLNPIYKFSNYFNSNSSGLYGLPETKSTNATPAAELDAAQKASPKQDLNLIYVDSVFVGSGIKEGSVDLKFYITGTLAANATDALKDGVLREQTNTRIGASTHVGFVLYKEGMVVLTNSSSLGTSMDNYIQPTASAGTPVLVSASWAHFMSYNNVAVPGLASSSYSMEFKGTQTIPTLTMFAYAPKNDLNWSNNPTYLVSAGGSGIMSSASNVYLEDKDSWLIKNTVSSSFSNYSSSYVPQTFISTIGVYDDYDNLIAIGRVANPVRKTNEQDYTFKLKLDL